MKQSVRVQRHNRHINRAIIGSWLLVWTLTSTNFVVAFEMCQVDLIVPYTCTRVRTHPYHFDIVSPPLRWVTCTCLQPYGTVQPACSLTRTDY
jgi:hypothetical protein